MGMTDQGIMVIDENEKIILYNTPSAKPFF
ncbi:hypothetical protein SDC9_10063 [bioreactor metagenome]|uniref:Uncharacterized protein n=2 Tax=root TaxID=1 RepID=A0A098AWM6_DESHA|nr:Hypothetical protein DPCES_1101 [Desulfitobacterium hafniense]